MNFEEFCKHQHDVVCNQKYGGDLPYSFHLKAVVSQFYKWKHLISKYDYDFALEGCWGHDLIEDARITYNDIFINYGRILADIIFACTESTGRNRTERHDQVYFDRLKSNNLAVFVKLCDLSANILFSMLTGSSMYKKYKNEFPHFYDQTYIKEYDEFYKYIKGLLNL